MELHERLVSEFGGVWLRMMRLLDRRMASEGASLARTRILLMIDKREQVKASDISEFFGLAPRTVTDALDGMERQGLLRREPDPADRRVRRLVLTPQGKEALAATEPTRLALVGAIMGALSADEAEEFSRLLGKLEAAVAAQEDASA